jgi:hypothetical protein
MKRVLLTSLFIICFVISGLRAEDLSTEPFKFNLYGYLAYQTQLSQGDLTNNAFSVNRAYFTAKKDVYKFLSLRLTTDVYQDASGGMNLRLKYMYANFKFDDFSFLTKPNIEAGMVHTPWLDYEEAINQFRMQGTMFMERNKLFASADLGVTFLSNFGGEMDDNYKKKVDGAYAGKYGSLSLGIYNGSGYSAAEANFNKTIQARVSFRPLPDIIPGLQLTYFGIFGKGNKAQKATTDTIPDWMTNTGMLTFESENFTLTGQYFAGKGNSSGSYSANNTATKISGYSVFALGKLDNWRLLARYDSFNPNTDQSNNANNRVIVGVGYNLGNNNILLLDFDKNYFQSKASADVNLIKLTMQYNI